MVLDLPNPPWWSKDVPFDKTGQTQLGWAKEGAARYREAAAKAPGRSSAKSKAFGALKAEMGVTGVTPSVTVSKGALRAKRFRDKNRTAKEKHE